ncbi:hypothetical protein [Azospirillum largimobile]
MNALDCLARAGDLAPRLMGPYMMLGYIYELFARADEARGCYHRTMAIAKRQKPVDRRAIASAQASLDRIAAKKG